MQDDKSILRRLAQEYIDAASPDILKKNTENWIAINSLHMKKPMVMIDQIPWHEMNINGELDIKCADPFFRGIETEMRRTLYRWRHMPGDMVLPMYVTVPKIYTSSGIGVDVVEETTALDTSNDVVSHEYFDQISSYEDLEKIHRVVITSDEAMTKTLIDKTKEVFDGLLPVRAAGTLPEFRIWDALAQYRGVTPILYDLADRPEFIHAIMEKFTDIHLDLLDQYERLELLDGETLTIHCSGALTDELPAPDFSGHVRGIDCWGWGMAQVFSNCSPGMHDEFEIEYAKKYYARCGLVDYGCCEPLHDKIDIIRKLPNIRKISISPFADARKAAERMGGDYVMSRKPNPAFVAAESVDENAIRKEIADTLEYCKANGTPCEFILKDISTVQYKPERLFRWNAFINEIIEDFM